MPSDALEILRHVNDNLRFMLVRLRPETRHCSALQPRDFSELLNQVIEATECLRNVYSHSPAASRAEKHLLEKETLEYRGHLGNLKRCLPDLHVRLLAERERLEAARSHLAAASSWAGARKQTL